MSEIPERVTRYRIDNGGFLQEHSRGNLVEITSAVPAIREQVLADAKARIEEINIEHHVMPHRHDDYALFEVALNCALAALTQPQSEEKKFIRQGADGSTEFVSTSGGGAATEECDCPSLLDCRENAGAIPADCAYAALMEGGAATPRGVADADLEGEGVYEAVYACLDACGGTMGSTALHFLADLDERGFRVVRATHESFTEEPGPYAKAFRERVCPVPEFPGIEKEES